MAWLGLPVRVSRRIDYEDSVASYNQSATSVPLTRTLITDTYECDSSSATQMLAVTGATGTVLSQSVQAKGAGYRFWRAQTSYRHTGGWAT